MTVRKFAAVIALALSLAGCATTTRIDAAADVHALLVSIRDDDRTAFDRHVDRRALKNQLEGRMMREVGQRTKDDGARAVAALLAPSLADAATDALVQPRVFRTVANYYGYTPDKPLPGQLAIAGALKYRPDGSVCATRKSDGPCILVFTNVDGTWKLSGFEGDLKDLRGKR